MNRKTLVLRLAAAALTLLLAPRAFAQSETGLEHRHTDDCYEDGLYDDVEPAAPATVTLTVGFFGKNIAMLAAQDKGFLAAEGINVVYEQVKSSEQAFTDLMSGHYQILLSSVDNVVNYRTNPNNALGGILPVQAFMSVDYANNLTVAGKLGITKVEDFKGKRMAVDAPASGFAYVLYDVLADHGLVKGQDYSLVLIGGGAQRFNSLMAGQVDGTLLNNGFELRAAAGGRPLFETAYDVTWPYLGSVGVAREDWMANNSDVLQRFIRAYVAASAWSFDPANHAAAVAEMQTQPNTSAALAEKLLNAQLTPGRGLVPDAYIGQFERAGLLNVLRLRQKYDGFELPQNLKTLSLPAGKIYDLTYYQQAVAGTGNASDRMQQ